MIQRVICLWLFLFCIANATAQNGDSPPKPRIQFCSKNEFGVSMGMGTIKGMDDFDYRNKESVLELSSSNGIRYGRLFVGAGIGVRKWGNDYLLPLFFTSSLNLWNGKNSLFLHLDVGNQFGNRKPNFFGDKETGNFFIAYGLGYDFSVTEHMKLYLKASVSHQHAKALGPYSGLGPYQGLESYDLKYLFFKISVGVRIN
ncbi:hypothetical protein [Fluviicola sp.]|uniref:hypothetical protein n=1 Tax=Fluviicola sp. TaxID=1917219 RepID=UPI00261A325E|nr:hypothetical protein [Fluviicola sp.]